MKILYVTTISNTVNGFLIPHIKMLIREGHQVDVAFSVVQEVDPELKNIGCKIHKVPFQRSPFRKENIRAYKFLKKIVVRGRYDLVHTHTPVASAITRLVCKNLKNVKVFYTAHGFHFYKGAPFKSWILYYLSEKWLSRYTDCLITINKEDYDIAIKRFKSDKVKMVHGVGIELNRFQPQTIELKNKVRKEYGYKEDDFILFFAAELNKNKHQDLLINAVNILKKKIPNIKLLLAGTGPLEEQYKKQAHQLGMDFQIQFLGYRNDIENLLMISDIAVASSRREGLPVNVMEAMATGLPLVVTDIRGNRDLVNDGKNGYVINLDNVNEFVYSVDRLYNDDEIRKKFSVTSLELVKKYSLENVLKEMKFIYKIK